MSARMLTSVCRAMEKVAPLRLAEAWDNVGLLLESPISRPNAPRVLLTIDLTTSVVEEALSTPTSIIVSYHPTIFSGLKSLTMANPLQQSLLRCAAAGISVFSPHTSLDSVRGGVNDWLASGLGKGTVEVLEPKEDDHGLGRLVTLEQPLSPAALHDLVKRHLNLRHIQVGRATTQEIRSVAICAGSGASVLKGVKADAYFTGEMSHHDVLAAVASNTHVVLCGHSNTERGYLPILASKLREALESEGESYEIFVSQKDKDPLEII